MKKLGGEYYIAFCPLIVGITLLVLKLTLYPLIPLWVILVVGLAPLNMILCFFGVIFWFLKDCETI